MKKIAMLLMALSLMVGGGALAEDKGDAQKHPCKTIKQACEAAGFVKGGHKNNNKGLHVDCMEPIMKGQSVPGVTVEAGMAQACRAKMEKKHGEHPAGAHPGGHDHK